MTCVPYGLFDILGPSNHNFYEVSEYLLALLGVGRCQNVRVFDADFLQIVRSWSKLWKFDGEFLGGIFTRYIYVEMLKGHVLCWRFLLGSFDHDRKYEKLLGISWWNFYWVHLCGGVKTSRSLLEIFVIVTSRSKLWLIGLVIFYRSFYKVLSFLQKIYVRKNETRNFMVELFYRVQSCSNFYVAIFNWNLHELASFLSSRFACDLSHEKLFFFLYNITWSYLLNILLGSVDLDQSSKKCRYNFYIRTFTKVCHLIQQNYLQDDETRLSVLELFTVLKAFRIFILVFLVRVSTKFCHSLLTDFRVINVFFCYFMTAVLCFRFFCNC